MDAGTERARGSVDDYEVVNLSGGTRAQSAVLSAVSRCKNASALVLLPAALSIN